MDKIINELTSYILTLKRIPSSYRFILHALLENKESEVKKRSDLIKEQVNTINPSIFSIDNYDFDLSTEIVEKGELSSKDADYSNYKIESLQIKNFRGFGPFRDCKNDKGVLFSFCDKKRKKSNFNKIIIYGPNGSGKSSFCEAIEYKLTGQIKECRRRNIKINDYITCGKLKPEINIVIRDKQDNEVPFDYIPLDVREKCFIEHNRIQAFALLDSKQTGDKQKDILATLIGLENLQEFIDSFVKPNSFRLDKSTKYQKDYNTAQQEKSKIEIEIGTLKNSLQKEIYDGLNKALKTDDNACYLFSQKMKLLNEEIQKAEDELLSLQKPFNHIDEEEYTRLVTEIGQIFGDYKQKEEDYSQQKDKINFKNLYLAVISLKDNVSNEKCPLCETDVSKTVVNPFTKAEIEIKNLEGILKLESDLEELKIRLLSMRYYDRIKELNEKILTNIEELNWEFKAIPFTKDIFTENDKLKTIESFLEIYSNNREFFTEYFHKNSTEKKEQDRLKSEFEIKKQIIAFHQKQKNNLETMWETKKKREDGIKEKNESLIEIEKNIAKQKVSSEKEVLYNEFLDKIEASYQDFFSDLINFKKKIERETIDNTEKDIVNYYRQINKGDSDCEQIKYIKIVIPDKDTDKYDILLKRDDGEVSATQHLSEGHLRALGLSIILAIAKKCNAPFIIFDDVVNAIDLEHRSNLIDLFFSDDVLKKKQLIITTHDRLFWERFCNKYETRMGNKSLISFTLRYTQLGVLYNQYDVGFSQKIEEAIDNYDIRQALNYCRILLETKVIEYCITNKMELTAFFAKNRITKSNLLEPSLDMVYSVFEKDTNIKNNMDYKKLKKDPIVWQLLNQEHHAFDENSLNAIHAKTSAEIREVFEDLTRFCDFLAIYAPLHEGKKSGLDNNQLGLFHVTDGSS